MLASSTSRSTSWLVVMLLSASNCSDPGDSDAMLTDADAVRSPACDRFLECAAAVAPATVADLIERYGETGTCFEGSPSEIRLCNAACRDARAMLAQAFEHRSCDECSRDEHCQGVAASRCDPSTGTCVHCTADEHCDSDAPICDRMAGQCVACLANDDCEEPQWCHRSSGRCVECEPESRVCVGTKPVHCSADGAALVLPPCDATSTCKAGECERKPYGPCSSVSDCSPGWVCAAAGQGRWCAPHPGGMQCSTCPAHEFPTSHGTRCLATHVCGVLCSSQNDCPSGMQCEASEDLMVCTWPAS